ncbi:S-layer homology domain-containing protein [Paenibacillus sp. 32352]|uniref:S-layer homology domain-containing protein n=1 Tax=Paenibacillus sp. 32352 TaxID=1969111 RepID=UPI0009AE1250|nr:S-layer homology domain-containing protein [Paenibacillus sp. 32352]
MNGFMRFKKTTAILLTAFMVTSSGIWNAPSVSASSSSGVDVLDPDFIASHGGNFVHIDADPNRSPFDVFGEAFGTDNPVEGATKTVRQILPEAARHVENIYDAALGQEVFKVEVNGNDCYTCYLHGTTYDPATGQFTGGNDDRQRIEIRPAEESRNLVAVENEITAFHWKLKIDKDIQKPDGFFHIFQYKAYNSFGLVGNKLPLHDVANYPNFSSSEDGNPILTFTISSSATQNLEFRYADIGTDAGQETLASVPLNSVKDKWVDITVKVLNSEYGWVTMTMKDAATGKVIMEYNDPNRVLDMWRRPEIKYNNQTFEGPYPAVSNMINRPKWGIYRKADKSNPNVKDAKIYLADMTVAKSAVGVSSVNLAYNKKAYNVGTKTGNALQLANAKAERLTDGVQVDPVKYTNLTAVPLSNTSALGDLSWMGTESSKKGNVIVDLGKKMDFNQVKLFAKTLRLKYVNVSITDDTADHDAGALESVSFTPVDPLYTDGGKDWTYFNAANGGGDDTADKQYIIDLGKAYSSRYVKFYFENGSGSNTAGTTTAQMTGPPRLTELEIYNAPQTPNNVKVDYTGGSEATISWDPVPADYFVIYDNGKPFVENAASNSFKLTNLDPGAEYQFTVRTAYTDPYSFKPMLSAESEAKVLHTDGNPIIPNPPVSVTATAVSDKSINVSWDAVSDAQSYKVVLATDGYERTIANDYKDTSYTIKDLSPGMPYQVKVYSIRRGTPSTAAAEGQIITTGIRNPSDNLLFNKEVQYSRVWNDDTSSYGAGKALDNDVDSSRWVALKGSASAWMMVDIGETTPVNTFEYYSYQNKLKKVSFYYATDGEAFTDPNSSKWIKIVTDDRVSQGKYGNPAISKIAERITILAPVNARFIKFTVDEVDGDINVNEVKAFGPISFVGASALKAVNKTDTSVDLNWGGATTNLPASSYEIYQGNGKLATVSANVYSYKATNLSPNTDYAFRVRAVSESVYNSVYSTLGGLTLKVTTLPASGTDPGTTDPGTTDPGTTDPGTTDPGTTDPGTSDPGTTDPGTTDPGTTDPGTTDPGTPEPGVIAAPTGLTAVPRNSQVFLSWNTVSGATYYNVKRSMTAGGDYSTVAANVTNNVYTDTGLLNGTKYYYVVTAANAKGESINSSEVFVTPYAVSSGRGSSGSSGGTSAGTGTPSVQPSKDGTQTVTLDPVMEKADDGRSIAKVALDTTTLAKAMEALTSNGSTASKLTIEAKHGDAATAKFQLPAQPLADALSKLPALILSVKYGDVTYDLPIRAVDFAGMAKSLGVDMKDLSITITMEKVNDTILGAIKDRAKQSGLTLLSGAIDFQVTIEGKGKSAAVNDFGLHYVTRTMNIGKSVDAKKATAVLYNPSNGEFSFVPAIFTTAGGSTQVMIQRPGNSIYAVAESSKTFADMSNHWAKADVELLASKLVVKGMTDTGFMPDNRITRAEFAAILVRGLGLSENNAAKFNDVKTTDWYAGAVGTAAKAGLVDGFEDGTFKPDANVTREQMAVMVARAMKITTKEPDADIKALDKFTDQTSISGWAKEATAQAVNAGIINGMTDRTFVPAEHATRAEAAVMVKRLLQYAQLMN